MELGPEIAFLHAQDPIHATKALRLAEPVDQTVLDSIAFLHSVAGVRIVGGNKKEFELLVELRDSTDASKEASSFTVKRSIDDVFKLQHGIIDACRVHPIMSHYKLPPCTLCDQFKILPDLPVDTFDRFTKSLATIRELVETRLNQFVRGAVVPPNNTQYYCEGLMRMPNAVADFLLRDVAVQVSQQSKP